MQIARQGALRNGRRRSCGRGDQREQRPRLTRCPRGRCSCRVLLSKRSTCARGHALPSMSAAWRARPTWNGGAGGAEAEAVLAPTRRLHDAQAPPTRKTITFEGMGLLAFGWSGFRKEAAGYAREGGMCKRKSVWVVRKSSQKHLQRWMCHEWRLATGRPGRLPQCVRKGIPPEGRPKAVLGL